MKIAFVAPVVSSLALLLSACGPSASYTALAQQIDQQNKTILDQQQTLLDQQQRVIEQETRLAVLDAEVAALNEAIKRNQNVATTDPNATPASTVDQHKVSAVRLLSGFSARLDANISYGSYSDALSDLNANLMQSMLDVKDQAFADEVNRVLCLYNYAGEFWQRFAADGVDEIRLNPNDRYKYANVGVNFIDSYNPRPSDVKKFWAAAADEMQKLVDNNRDALGRDDNNVRLFAR